MNIKQPQDSSLALCIEQSSVSSVRALMQMSFAEIEAFSPGPDDHSTLVEREPFLLKEVSDFAGIPRNDDVSIEDLTQEDMDLPIEFI